MTITVERELVGTEQVRKYLRSRKTFDVFVTMLLANDVGYARITKREALWQLAKHGAEPTSCITWTVDEPANGEIASLYITPNRSI